MNFKTLAIFGFVGIGMVYGKDVAVEEAFVLSLPDSAKQGLRSPQGENYPDTILAKYFDDSFQLHMYRWPSIKGSVPLDQIPGQWIQNKKWVSVSGISEGKTDSGIPYVTFNARIVRDNRPAFDSVMTVLRSPTGEVYMFQMTGDTTAIDAIRKSIRYKQVVKQTRSVSKS